MSAARPIRPVAAPASPAQPASLRQRFIAQTEQAIDQLRAEKDELLDRAAALEAQELEARALLQQLRGAA